MKVALAQLDPVVGDVAGNVSRLASRWGEAAQNGADLLIATELYVTGYPPEDLVLKPSLQKLVTDAVEGLARMTASGPAILLGAPWMIDGKLYNAALLLDGGVVSAVVRKQFLPNEGPFDEKRAFVCAPESQEPVAWRGMKLGVMICEDMWKEGPSAYLRDQGAQLLIVLNGSPFELGKQIQRHNLAIERARETGLPLIYINHVGGQDELVFEGGSFVMSAEGELVLQAPFWEESLVPVVFQETDGKLVPESGSVASIQDREEALYMALMTGLRDHVRKNKFSRVILGLSGGIDCALIAALAVDALGADLVRFVMIPAPSMPIENIDDATAVARALGKPLASLPASPALAAFDQILAVQFMGCQPDMTEINIESRCRSVMLMALADKSHALLLASVNKTELAVGFAALYGEMAGAYAPLKDVYKTDVYRLARWRNTHVPATGRGPSETIFPESVLAKTPSSDRYAMIETEDPMPASSELDDILTGLVEDDLGVAEMAERGIEASLVRRVLLRLDRAEYKRRQAPPGPKVSRRHLTRDRRYPMTNRYLDD